ncbi:MAG: glycosyltransferase family 1 protein [Patescibacteria group bacterium]|jgi:glycosyltransferase involved in cell wall biosynthesis
MITYGIDAHLLLRKEKDGVPRYTRMLLEAMMKEPLAEDERIILYAHGEKPGDLVLPEQWAWKKLGWRIPRGWTHGRLSIEMLLHPPSVLFVPGHEVPMLMRPSTKVATTLHDIAFKIVPDVYEPSVVRRQDLAVRRAISRAQTILAPSLATKNDLFREYHIDAARITVTPLAPALPVVEEDPSAVLRRYQVSAGKYVFAMSRLEKKKNTLFLIRAFASLKRRLGHGHPLTLVLAGKFGFGEQEIRRAIAEENIEKDIRLPGYITDHDASILLRFAFCFAFPSRAEGFGISILEAMEHGTPVIASNIPSTIEVAGNAAMIVSQNDVSAFAQGIENLLQNSALCEQYRQAGFLRVTTYSWAHCAQKTLGALRAMIR